MIRYYLQKAPTLVIVVCLLIKSNTFYQNIKEECNPVISSIINHYQISELSKRSGSIANLKFKESGLQDIFSAIEFFNIRSIVDSAYMVDQLKTNNKILWKRKDFSIKIVIKNRASVYLSIPIFLNKEKSIALVYHTEYSGPLAAEGHFDLLIRIDQKWIVDKYYPLWMSENGPVHNSTYPPPGLTKKHSFKSFTKFDLFASRETC